MSFRGLQVLASSLRSVDARRPFVLLTDSASAADANVQATAHTWRLQVVQVALLAGTGMLCSQTANTRLAASFTTFAAWNLTQYDKVLWLEMDQLVLRPLDTLWAMHLGDASVAAAPTAGSTSCSNVLFGFNSGVQLLRPSAIMLAEFLAALYSGKYECGSGFQALWNSVPNAPASTAFALLNFRFDMEFKEPENFAARIADAAAAIRTNQTKSPTLGNGSEWEAVPSPTSILVAFRTRSGLKLGVNVRGPKIGWIYNLNG